MSHGQAMRSVFGRSRVTHFTRRSSHDRLTTRDDDPPHYNHGPMLGTWLVRLELARDDDGPLSDEGLESLTQLLAQSDVESALSQGSSGTVLVQVTLSAKDGQAARSAAERLVRDGANTVWSALGLPPFTIAVVDAARVADPPPG
jgi:hypothetical protein